MKVPQDQIGQLVPEDENRRDAIHIAIAPVKAACYLSPGEHIGLIEENNLELVGNSKNNIGIVDPFLEETVKPGQRFWMFLYPNTITSLRHIWEHPSFKEEKKEKEEAEKWLREFCKAYDANYQWLIEAGMKVLEKGGYINCHDNQSLCGALYEIKDEFLKNLSKIVDIPVNNEANIYFTCGC